MLRNVTQYASLQHRHIRLRNATIWRASSTSHRAGNVDEDELRAARQWLAKLDADTIRNNATCDISFSRSSGPGGQNVNKSVNTEYPHPPASRADVNTESRPKLPCASPLARCCL